MKYAFDTLIIKNFMSKYYYNNLFTNYDNEQKTRKNNLLLVSSIFCWITSNKFFCLTLNETEQINFSANESSKRSLLCVSVFSISKM